MRRLKLATLTVAIVVSGLATSGAMAAGPTLAAVKKNGVVTCGVSTGLAGFSMPDQQGKYTGIDADTCRQLAAAIFGDATKVKFAPLSAQQRFTALQSGEVDVLTRNTTWSLLRDTELGLNFAPPTFYDGQGFMVAKKLGAKSVKDLNGATRGRCDAYTDDASALASSRITKAPNPDDYVILPEIISKEPLAPAVRHGDDEWFDLVKWVVFAAIEAEEKGVASQNVDDQLKSSDPGIQRLLGVDARDGPGTGGR
jgi:general L-amino acid transport system substrate-binding protein